MKTVEQECPFCGELAKTTQDFETLQTTYRDCLCGEFVIDEDALDDVGEREKILKTDEAKILFSGYLRNNQPLTITNEFIEEDLPGILDYCQTIPVSEKISKIKSYIYQKTPSIGEPVQIENRNLYTLFYLKNYNELNNLLGYLSKIKILEISSSDTGTSIRVTLTIEGFSEIESTLRNHIPSKKVFIACKFDTDYQNELVQTIKAACLSCGFEASLVSDERHNKDISHKIISDIKQSKFVIADFTDQNNGVYFEAGYAMGESKEVIRLINKEQFEKLHFDTRQFHHIPWENGKWEELKEDLINQIKATIK